MYDVEEWPTHGTRMRVTDVVEKSISRFIFIDAPDGYEIELVEESSSTAII